MNRRKFLYSIVGAPVAAAVLPEALPEHKEVFFQLNVEDLVPAPIEIVAEPAMPWVFSGYISPQDDWRTWDEQLRREQKEHVDRAIVSLVERLEDVNKRNLF